MRALALVVAACAVWAPDARAQSAVQAPTQRTEGPCHRGYWSAGYLRTPFSFDALLQDADGYGAATVGLGFGVFIGLPRGFYADVSFGVGLGGGGATGPYGYRGGVRADWDVGGTTGAKVFVGSLGGEWRTWIVAFTGVTWSVASLFTNRESPEVLDPGVFDSVSRVLSSPVGLFATFGNREIQISPSASVAYGWLVNQRTRLGEPPAVLSSQTTGGDLVSSFGLDLGFQPSATYLGLTWDHAWGLGTMPSHNTYGMRVTWVLRGPSGG